MGCSLIQADNGGFASATVTVQLFDAANNSLGFKRSSLTTRTLPNQVAAGGTPFDDFLEISRSGLPAGNYRYRSTFKVVADGRVLGAARAFCDTSVDTVLSGLPGNPFEEETTGIDKDIVSGPDIIEAGQLLATEYEFKIAYNNPDGPPVVIRDTAPAEWQVNEVAGNAIIDGFGMGPDGNGGAGTVDVGAANKKTNNKSATKIEWTPDAGIDSSMINVVVETRPSPGRGNPAFKPTSCGPLVLNDGAEVFELDPATGEPRRDPATGDVLPPIFVSAPLLLGAVEDLDGIAGVVGDGSGDEDLDGATDGDEIFSLGTDSCIADTDGDGLNDGEDQCPIEGIPDTDAGESLGANGCIVFPPSP